MYQFSPQNGMTNAPLYSAIYRGMRYWFCRLILDLGAKESDRIARWVSPVTSLRARGNWKRRRYHTLRAQMPHASSYVIQARLFHSSAAQIQQRTIAYQRRRRIRWGGQPSHVGSPAWCRWMIAKCEPQGGEHS